MYLPTMPAIWGQASLAASSQVLWLSSKPKKALEQSHLRQTYRAKSYIL